LGTFFTPEEKSGRLIERKALDQIGEKKEKLVLNPSTEDEQSPHPLTHFRSPKREIRRAKRPGGTGICGESRRQKNEYFISTLGGPKEKKKTHKTARCRAQQRVSVLKNLGRGGLKRGPRQIVDDAFKEALVS